MATQLSRDLVDDALEALPGWEGDTESIAREVALAPEHAEQLVARVAEDAGARGHEPLVERVEGGARFVLTTSEVGGVSELDIALASRISDLAHQLDEGTRGVEAVRQDEPEVYAEGTDGPKGIHVRFQPAKSRNRS